MVTNIEIPEKLLISGHDGMPFHIFRDEAGCPQCYSAETQRTKVFSPSGKSYWKCLKCSNTGNEFIFEVDERLHFSWKDMADTETESGAESWLRLVNGSPNLKSKHFKDINKFRIYFLLTCDFLEGNVIITGKEGSGKSVFAYHLAYRRKQFFGIPALFNRKPKKAFGEYEVMPDDEFKSEIDKFNQLVKEIEALDLDDDEPLPSELQDRIEKLRFYRRTYVIDEAYKDVEKGHVTNRTRLYGQLARQFRHLHTTFVFISPDPDDITGRLIFDRQTHRVECRYRMGMCNYTILVNTPKVRGLVKNMELDPRIWGKIFNSYNLVGTTNMKVYN